MSNIVLLLAGHDGLRRFLSDLLRDELAIVVRSTSSVEEAQRALSDGIRPAVVLLDIAESSISGKEALRFVRYLKGNPETACVPIVVLGYDDVRRQAEELGWGAHLSKDVLNIHVLTDLISGYLEKGAEPGPAAK